VILLIAQAADNGALGGAGRGARVLDDEITFQWILGGAIYLLVVGLLAAIVLRQRRRAAAGEPAPEDERGHRWIWIGGIVLPLVAISAVVAVSAHSLSALERSHHEPHYTIEVVGHRWWWEVRYPDQHAITANEVVLPVGEPVRLLLTTQDVIHSFWVPKLDRKLDMVPGRRNELVLTAERAGTYRGECAEFCGLQHAHMRFQARALPMAEFQSWLRTAAEPAVEPATDAAREGQRVFLSGTCAACHTIEGTPAGGSVGPPLTHLASRPEIAAGAVPRSRGNLAAWISDPQQIKPGAHMPRSTLTGAELQSLLDYLETLR
jgi:cytochrome c oxidase subunit 2